MAGFALYAMRIAAGNATILTALWMEERRILNALSAVGIATAGLVRITALNAGFVEKRAVPTAFSIPGRTKFPYAPTAAPYAVYVAR